jgi:hypothetical protein
MIGRDQIFADSLITARQLAQRPQSIFSVVDRFATFRYAAPRPACAHPPCRLLEGKVTRVNAGLSPQGKVSFPRGFAYNLLPFLSTARTPLLLLSLAAGA